MLFAIFKKQISLQTIYDVKKQRNIVSYQILIQRQFDAKEMKELFVYCCNTNMNHISLLKYGMVQMIT